MNAPTNRTLIGLGPVEVNPCRFPFAAAVLSGNAKATEYAEEVAGWLSRGPDTLLSFRRAIRANRDRALIAMGLKDLLAPLPVHTPDPYYSTLSSRFD